MSATPIIPGFHPDPSICRVGDDYYLVNSSFEYLPGVPIFHSRDLVTWELIGNVLDREDQLALESSAGSSGIFAPTIRHHDGRFWMITTCINRVREGHLIVSATDPAGPWTTPVYTTGVMGIDPDLFWDEDGTCYLTWAGGWDGGMPIMQVAIDPETGELLGEPRGISGGTGLANPEGPHLYRRGDWYYLLLAEGGTERGHTVTIARSRSVDGPFEEQSGEPDPEPPQHDRSGAEHRARRPRRDGGRLGDGLPRRAPGRPEPPFPPERARDLPRGRRVVRRLARRRRVGVRDPAVVG